MRNLENEKNLPILAEYYQAAFIMKYRILRLIALFVLLVSISSCFEGRWANYKKGYHYGHRKNYRRYHEHGRGDW